MKNGRSFILLGLFLFCILFLWHNLRKPFYNWDMIGYVASVISFESHEPSVIHSRVFSLLKESVPSAKYEELTEGHDRQIRATDPESLRQHLPFYQIRILYNVIIYALYKIGVNPFFASHLISVVSSCIAIGFLAFLFPDNVHPQYYFFIPFVSLVYGLDNLARLSTPDALSFLLITICYYLLLHRNRAILLLIPTLILSRTDLIILAVIFLIYLYISGGLEKRLILFSAIATLGAYVVVNRFYGSYGWKTVFYYTLVQKMPYPATDPVSMDYATYIAVFIEGLAGAASDSMLITYIIVYGLAQILLWNGKKLFKQTFNYSWYDISFLLFSTSLYISIHFFLFPVTWYRFFSGQYILATCIFIYLLLEYMRLTMAGNRGPLRGANLTNANLDRANLTGTNLLGADETGGNLDFF